MILKNAVRLEARKKVLKLSSLARYIGEYRKSPAYNIDFLRASNLSPEELKRRLN